ncbi:unnamed protein product, partial [Rotaria sp. Silwood2]
PRQPKGSVNILWDIENLAVPAGRSAFSIVMKLRQRLITERNMAEGSFAVFCDVTKLPKKHQEDLHHANVDIQHVPNCKSVITDKAIYKAIQLFKEQQRTPATLVLLSGDIDFIRCISELRFNQKHYVIIAYNAQANTKLLETANETIPWSEFTDEPRVNTPKKRDPPKPNPNQMVLAPEKVDTDKPRVNTPKKRDPPKPNLSQMFSVAQTANDAASRIPSPGVLLTAFSQQYVAQTNNEDSKRINPVPTDILRTRVKRNKERLCDQNPKM